MRLKETVQAWRRNTAIAREIRQQQEDFDNVEALLCEAMTFDQWWTSLCKGAEELEFVRISLSLTNRDGSRRTLLWQRPGSETPVHEKVSVAVPVQQRRSGGPLKAEVEVYLNGSIESAGRRIALFGRLIDDHGLTRLPRRPAPVATAGGAGGQGRAAGRFGEELEPHTKEEPWREALPATQLAVEKNKPQISEHSNRRLQKYRGALHVGCFEPSSTEHPGALRRLSLLRRRQPRTRQQICSPGISLSFSVLGQDMKIGTVWRPGTFARFGS